MPVLSAVRANRPGSLAVALSDSGDPNQSDGKTGETALMAAASLPGDAGLEMAKQLLSAGALAARRDDGGSAARDIALRHGNQAMAELLASAVAFAKTPDAALLAAARGGGPKMADEAIRAGASPDAADPWLGKPALLMAAERGMAGCVSAILKRGGAANCHCGGTTPLMAAAERNHAGIAGLLLSASADPHARDGNGSSALHKAAAAGFVGVLDVMISAGGDPNIRDNAKRTPLHEASESGQAEAAAFLIAHGADAAAVDANGIAAAFQDSEMPPIRKPPAASPKRCRH